MMPSPSEHPCYLTQLQPDIIESLSVEQLTALSVLEDQFDVDQGKLEIIVKEFQHEFRIGLENSIKFQDENSLDQSSPPQDSKNNQKDSKNHSCLRDHESIHDKNSNHPDQVVNLPMLPTFIHDVPRGDEKGLFLALDLGGTNLRVCEVTLNGDKTFDIKSDKYLLSSEIKTGTAEELFSYIADCVKTFLLQLGHKLTEDEKLHLGFTFSFPVVQSALAEGKLLDWTKGFKASGTVGVDVVKLLQNALDEKKIPVHCNALVNDTVGTLMARAYESGSALVGAIFGTGTNAAYVERLSAVKKLSPQSLAFPNAEKMIINTEWGAFDNLRTVLPITPYDNKLDRESINPRKQTLEKMVSGMYLGELTRNVLMDLIDRGLLFESHSTEKLNQHYGFDTALMSQIDGGGLGLGKDKSKQFKKIEELMRCHFTIKNGKTSDWILIERVCEIVATRAARLSAAALAAVLKQTCSDPSKLPKLSIGVDGSLIERYDKFMDRLQRGLSDLFPEDIYNKIEIELAKDGSGVGAALCALQAKKQEDLLDSMKSLSV